MVATNIWLGSSAWYTSTRKANKTFYTNSWKIYPTRLLTNHCKYLRCRHFGLPYQDLQTWKTHIGHRLLNREWLPLWLNNWPNRRWADNSVEFCLFTLLFSDFPYTLISPRISTVAIPYGAGRNSMFPLECVYFHVASVFSYHWWTSCRIVWPSFLPFPIGHTSVASI